MPDVRLRRLTTPELTPPEIAAIRAILWAAFDDPDEPDEAFTEHDWEHGLGGVHVIAKRDGRIVAHGSVVDRDLRVAGRRIAAGYVESVATEPGLQRTGLGSAVMGEIGAIILISGNLPYKTEVASVFVYQRISGDPHGAAAVSVVMLTISFLVLLGIGGLRRYATRFERA